MLTVEGCSETDLLRHLSNHVFHVFRKYISYEVLQYINSEIHKLYFFKIFKISNISKMKQKIQKLFFISFNNWIWIFWLLQREYLSSADNLWRSSPKNLDITNRNTFILHFPLSDIIKVLCWGPCSIFWKSVLKRGF